VDSGDWPPQPTDGLALVYSPLRDGLAEPSAALAARLQAVGACLAQAGLRGDQVAVTRTTSDGWALLETPEATVGCVLVELSGVPSPVAIALLVARSTRLPAGVLSGVANALAGLPH
jgi:hypothetical protein